MKPVFVSIQVHVDKVGILQQRGPFYFSLRYFFIRGFNLLYFETFSVRLAKVAGVEEGFCLNCFTIFVCNLSPRHTQTF